MGFNSKSNRLDMPGDVSSGDVFLAVTSWRAKCLTAGIVLRILSGGLGSDGWLDQEIKNGVRYFKLHLWVCVIFPFYLTMNFSVIPLTLPKFLLYFSIRCVIRH